MILCLVYTHYRRRIKMCQQQMFKRNPIQTNNSRIELKDKSTIIDSDFLTAWVYDGNLLGTWESKDWRLFAVDREERFAFFEGKKSCELAILDLNTKELKADDDPLFIQYSLEQDRNGVFVWDTNSTSKHYLRI
jgi:hypothetical protein